MCLKYLARDERIIIDGVNRRTVSSSLVLVGGEIQFFHIVGDPRSQEDETLRPVCR
jgi:hypothetical protein